MPDFYSIVTRSGGQAIAAAIAAGTPLVLTHMAVGDGLMTPVEGMSALASERWRGVCEVSRHPVEPGWVQAQVILPDDVGGWMVREVAVYAGEVLIAIGNYPDSYIPLMPGGARKTIDIKMVIEFSNATVIAP